MYRLLVYYLSGSADSDLVFLGQRQCDFAHSFFRILTFAIICTCLWLFGFEQDAQGVMLHRFRNVTTRVRTPLHGHPKLQTRLCSGQPKAKQNPKHWGVKNRILWCIKWLLLSLDTCSDFGLAQVWLTSADPGDHQCASYCRWCQEAWLAPLICLHLGCELGIQMFLALVLWSLFGGSITILPAGSLNRAETCDFMGFHVFQDT